MRRTLFATVLCLLVATDALAQWRGPIVISPPSQVGRLVTSLPATCTVGEVVFRTATVIGLYQCTATDTWAALVSGGVTIGSTALTGGTTTRVLFDLGGVVSEDADFTFVTDTLTVTKLIAPTSITNSALTAGRVVFSGTAGLQADDADFTFATDTATITKVQVGGAAGVLHSAADGVETFTGAGDGNDENLTLDFDNAAANTVAIASGTGVTNITWTGTLTPTAVTARLTASGSAPSVANVGANSCGTTAASIAGNDNGWNITVGATAGTQCRVAFTAAAANRWHCTVTNETTANLVRATYVDTTHVDVLGTMVAGDTVSGVCVPR